MRVLVIRPDGTHEVKDMVDGVSDGGAGLLEQLQAEVGGFIEGLTGTEVVFYLNEEGKYQGLPPNRVGTALVEHFYPGFSQRDVIVGNLLVLGQGSGGNEASVPEHIVKMVKSL